MRTILVPSVDVATLLNLGAEVSIVIDKDSEPDDIFPAGSVAVADSE